MKKVGTYLCKSGLFLKIAYGVDRVRKTSTPVLLGRSRRCYFQGTAGIAQCKMLQLSQGSLVIVD